MTAFSNHQIVLTAIGEDRPGIVSELTQLVSDCHCNIIDSRIAILGCEFTFIMLLNGDMSAISRIEHVLPTKAMELGLLTMMKRTASHTPSEFCAGYTLEYTGIDTPGTLSKVTRFFADSNISICSLKSDTYSQEDDIKMRCELEFNIPVDVDIDQFKISFESLSHTLNVDYIFKRIR
ncbi:MULTISPECIES: glycine cleavage system protein R [Pseudoalteromonas]|uniref:Glycine cleavage system transcriptional repressor n=1 Tax=Pseudoalteromonas fuliginea TaxID=1872678 RepID=A0A063KLM9_9GAMM|nr:MULTISPECIES: ACT domain-containing protein [Pseudoalteromonas]ALQ08617.1 transcriptional regulator [Pseudoalteromonas sp. Bsw20308]ATG77184.1 transcriptional regulator [Pseudoalteromonas sp. 1_2015MBL_MicDiv]KAA1161128.1 glycine cleavage system transcriptional repressor [Pseudoalteromonas fuliginea]KAA1164190.1 glycine cleavage system transcriptional repressor [Pseudoalteromonas fuliginea]KAA1169009.1 glycine cleavage system transcriptional repressor [Pseudoalteromonas fuliginea]